MENTKTGLQIKYFVLKPSGDNPYSEASRKAIRAYAQAIQKENPQLCEDLRKWVDDIHFKICKEKGLLDTPVDNGNRDRR